MVRAISLIVVALALAPAASAFPDTAPYAAEQWYLTADRAWNYWPSQPTLSEVKVAVVDSGIDAGDPAFAGKIAGGRSFVGGSWAKDSDGHGTFVAGLIAAQPADGKGIQGLAFNARLLIAKVVNADGSVEPHAETAAIRWAANAGARVINLSFGGVRDPTNLALDTYSPAEFAAIEYAYSKGALVVAAVGNGDQTPASPWPYADYPAALPHVLGVGAVNQTGSVPAFSNRDRVYVDLVAPGTDIFSTMARNLLDPTWPACVGVPYSNCGPAEFRDATGTSFAAPQAAAAAALLLGVDPALTPATDLKLSTGCAFCPPGRDRFSGWGRLDVEAALTLLAAGNEPAPDPASTNVDIPFARALTPSQSVTAFLDFWDNPLATYSVRLRRGVLIEADVVPSEVGAVGLTLWNPGTRTLVGPTPLPASDLAAAPVPTSTGHLLYDVAETGTYYLALRFLPPARPRVTFRLSVRLLRP